MRAPGSRTKSRLQWGALMQTRDISWIPEDGALFQGDIRYVLMRPDVVMGILRHVADPAALVDVMRRSACEHAVNSFNSYRQSGAVGNADPVAHCCNMASQLGWGSWNIAEKSSGRYVVEVVNSPFALAASGVGQAVCGWIAGVLQAVTVADEHPSAQVDETACVARGDDCCRFNIALSEPTNA